MNSFEYILLEVNFSWLFARLLPYLLIQMIAVLIYLISRKKIKFRRKIFNPLLSAFILFSPTPIYFYFFPIYQGDIYELGEKPKTKIKFSKDTKLVVFALPECPYCHESVVILKQLLKRNPKLKIEIWITGDYGDTFYNSILSKRVKILQNKQFEKTIYLTKGIFPTFAITSNGKLVECWSNQTFGARALDKIEFFFEK